MFKIESFYCNKNNSFNETIKIRDESYVSLQILCNSYDLGLRIVLVILIFELMFWNNKCYPFEK
jgi:hypothetical protein